MRVHDSDLSLSDALYRSEQAAADYNAAMWSLEPIENQVDYIFVPGWSFLLPTAVSICVVWWVVTNLSEMYNRLAKAMS